MSNNIEKAILEIASEVESLSSRIENLEYPDSTSSNYFGLLYKIKEMLKDV